MLKPPGIAYLLTWILQIKHIIRTKKQRTLFRFTKPQPWKITSHDSRNTSDYMETMPKRYEQ